MYIAGHGGASARPSWQWGRRGVESLEAMLEEHFLRITKLWWRAVYPINATLIYIINLEEINNKNPLRWVSVCRLSFIIHLTWPYVFPHGKGRVALRHRRACQWWLRQAYRRPILTDAWRRRWGEVGVFGREDGKLRLRRSSRGGAAAVLLLLPLLFAHPFERSVPHRFHPFVVTQPRGCSGLRGRCYPLLASRRRAALFLLRHATLSAVFAVAAHAAPLLQDIC